MIAKAISRVPTPCPDVSALIPKSLGIRSIETSRFDGAASDTREVLLRSVRRDWYSRRFRGTSRSILVPDF
jgi:hypothetical protein